MAAAGDCYFCGMMWLKILDATKELDGWNVYSLPKKMNSYFFFQPLIFRRYLGFSGDIVAKKRVPHKIWAPKKVAVLVGPWEPLGARLEPTLTQRASEVSQKRSIQLPKSTIAYPQIHFKGGFQRYTPSCESRGAFIILCPHPWGELFGKSLRLQRLVAELKVLRYDMVHAKM